VLSASNDYTFHDGRRLRLITAAVTHVIYH